MRTAAIAGASGLVGGRCLFHLLDHQEMERVTALVRKPLPVTHEKLEQRTVTFPSVEDAIPRDIEDAHCALGTTMKKAGSREAFLAVDRDAVLAFARACRARGARRFVLVSSSGADSRSMNFYLRVKGDVEHDVAALGFESLHVLRPSLLDGERAESRPGERFGLAVMRKVGAVLGTGFRYAPIHVDVVGRAMVKLALSPQRGVCVHESPALHALL
jgi:uncharacterized protein YbjT (DUF2867 family)